MKTTGLLLAALAGAVAIGSATASSRTIGHSTATCHGALTWRRAASLEGSVHTFIGRVTSTKYAASSSGSPTFLDVGNRYPNPNRLSLVIWIENRPAFSHPERKYRGKRVCVRGRVTDYGGTPEIILRRPSQIKIAG
jgi:micrococcal nuclease